MATKQIIERRAFSQGPDFSLSEDDTYFMLGCGACEHSFCFKTSGVVAANLVGDLFSGISPRRSTHQGLGWADDNIICPENPAH